MLRVLHCLPERLQQTDAVFFAKTVINPAAAAGHEQAIVIGHSKDDSCQFEAATELQGFPITFDSFPLPVMRTPEDGLSCRFTALSAEQITEYRQIWIEHLFRVSDSFEPDVIHTHHAWILSSLIHEVWPDKPVVVKVYDVDLEMITEMPQVLEPLQELLHSANAFLVNSESLADKCAVTLEIDRSRFSVIGNDESDRFNKIERTWRCLAKNT